MSDASAVKVYDLYAPILNFKKEVAEPERPAISFNWIPFEHQRRVAAYEILTALYLNYSRDYRFAPETGDESLNDEIFESGDPAWICDRIKAKLLGDTVTPVMPGPKSIKTLQALEKAAATDPALTQRVTELQAIKARISARESFIQDWFDDNNVLIEIDENETVASYCGDCVYLIEWLAEEARPNIKTYDPGFYFPTFNTPSIQPGNTEIVDRVIIAWQEYVDVDPENNRSNDLVKVWRDVYELRKTADGYTCWRQYGFFEFGSGMGADLEDFDESDMVEGSSAGWENVGIDFIPIVHIPNVKLQGYDFGMSNMHLLIDTFDSIINAVTDIKTNSEYLGGATVIASGKDVSLKKDATTGAPIPISIMPRTLYAMGEGGSATLLDTSQMQKALLDTLQMLDGRIIRNSQITDVGAGKVDPSQVPSGFALSIMLQPLLDKIGPMRLIRKRHYSTLFFYIQRLWQIFGSPEEKALFAGDLYDCYLNFGRIIPVDESAELDKYAKLLGILDEQTVLEMMKEDGWSFDIQTVLERKAAAKAEELKQQMDMFGMRTAADNQGNQ